MVLLVGGEISTVQPILELFGNVVHCGALGSGAALKVVLIGAIVAGVTVIGEAMALADTGADVAHLPVARAVHQRLLDFPAAATEDIGHIVKFIRAGIG